MRLKKHASLSMMTKYCGKTLPSILFYQLPPWHIQASLPGLCCCCGESSAEFSAVGGERDAQAEYRLPSPCSWF